MPTIPNIRRIYVQLAVSRPDGQTWVDLTDYLTQVTIDLGNVDSVGTENSGVDGVVRRLEFTLRNDGLAPEHQTIYAWPVDGTVAADRELDGEETLEGEDHGVEWLIRLLGQEPVNIRQSLSPMDRDSDWNKLNDQYEPLLWSQREVVFRVAAESEQESGSTSVFGEALGIGDGAQTTFSIGREIILRGSETVYINGVQVDGDDYSIDYESGEITFVTPPANGAVITADYTYFRTEFRGLLGSSIIVEGPTITCQAEDLSKRLQRKFIIEPREYGSEEGTALEVVLQQLLDDYLGDYAPVVYVEKPTQAVVSSAPQPWVVQHESVWDACQRLVRRIGWWLGYKWNEQAQDYVLTLMEPPRNKNAETADFRLTAEDDFYYQTVEITDQHVRNYIEVIYRTEDGERGVAVAKDDTSIAVYGEQAMQIEEANSDLIHTQEAAERFAEAALADLKDPAAVSTLELPWLPGLDVFAGVVIDNPQISSQEEFFAVESVRASFDFEANRFRMECVGTGRVVGGRAAWLEMETRPGSPSRPALTAVYSPETLTLTAGLDGTDPYIDAEWSERLNAMLYQVRWRATDDSEYESVQIQGTQLRITDLVLSKEYEVGVAVINEFGRRSAWRTGVVITQGALTPSDNLFPSDTLFPKG